MFTFLKAFGGKKQNNSPQIHTSKSDYSGVFDGINVGDATAPKLTGATALQDSTINGAVKLITSGVATTPLKLYKKTNGSTEQVNSHKILDLLNKPNGHQTNYDFISMMMTNALLGQGGLAIILRVPGSDRITELLPIPLGSYTIDTMNDGSVKYKVNYSDGSNIQYDQKDVIFIKNISLDGYSGFSNMNAARTATGLASRIETTQLGAATSGGNPSGILTFETEMTPDKKKQIREAWEAAYGNGGGKSGSVAVLDNNARFTPVSTSGNENQFLESRKHQIEEICRYFNINPSLLGHNSGVNSDGVAALMRQHANLCLNPWFTIIEQELTRKLLPVEDELFFDFDAKAYLRGNLAESVPHYVNLRNSGILTANEVRIELGYDTSTDPEADLLKPIKPADSVNTLNTTAGKE